MVDEITDAIIINGDGTQNKLFQNIQVVWLTRYNSCFELQLKSKNPKVDKKLIIEKTGRIYEIGLEDTIEGEKAIEFKKFSAFLGIQYLMDQAFLVFAEDAAFTCSFLNHDIFEIGSLGFVPFERNKAILEGEKGKKLKGYIKNIRKLFSEGYYFCYTYDLSLSRQKQAYSSERDWRFCWNSYLCKDLIASKIPSVWTIAIIQGYCSTFSVYIQGKKLDFYLFARRSCKKAGTRYNARGINDDGDVANYCELEQIILFNQFCCSQLQIRGSVPIFWRQRGITAQTKITRSFEFTNPAFLKHFEDIKKNYNYVLCVNLMKKSKEQEQMITEGFETHLKHNNLDFVRYKFFDFHTVCKDQKYEKVNPIIRELSQMNNNFHFYAEDLSNKTCIVTQKGIVRTNCLDCLDRTNVFQSKIALDSLVQQLDQLGVSLADQFGEDPLDHVDNNNLKQNHPFISKFKCIWADCGDAISKHYTGTGSTHTDVTKKGQRDIMGLLLHGYKSISRFYLQNFEDNVKQEAIDLVVGQHTESINIFNESVEKALIAKQDEYCNFSKIKVFVITWNVNGLEAPSQIDQNGSFFAFDPKDTPDVVCVGLQEIIEFNAKNFVSANNESEIKKWNQLILKSLQNYDQYSLTKHKDLYGILTLVYTKQSIQHRISKMNEDTVKLGYTSYMGAVCVKLYIDDASINFLNVNLDYNSKSKMYSLNDIHQRSYQQEGPGKTKDEKLESLDYNILFGDLGFSSVMQGVEVRQNIDTYERNKKTDKDKAQKALQNLLKNEEFAIQKQNSEYMIRYQEEKINFMPTFKYELYSSNYTQVTVPGWPDRIMIWCKEGDQHEQLNYNRRDLNYTNHRPVYANYILNIKKVNQEKKEQVLQTVYSELNQTAQKIEEEDIGDDDDQEDKLIQKN
ncbi:endonuclease/exonuclease/phosphatase family protein (macronuclear) [Tetrahymena thermophila SB210]|uniref:phosphoinositide 5-phosphatase n=1 Tax=Tetrahymena thermophila (strain SB210) TaxID=312017 RepID=Q23MB2_TETTS|nr:endonuclease/exonuclease/phosphatase family protein [Tetrahymena thermophila SB210]EAR97727.3 endonuclease/exonuclease/phosphatase family protein [Tetrahymena thermophila SB210]|eukprot:XP_001017972.3 endonuclease/exonuclease/phosphatase family protein [Tetrahymena thermophila SB210]